jgi:hypothetical protein
MRFNTIKMLVAVTTFVAVTLTQASIPSSYTGKPYSGDTIKGKPHQIPGIIKSVFFDEGGEGVAYHDNTQGKQDGGSNRKDAGGDTIKADESVEMQDFQDGRYADYNFVTGAKEIESKDVVGSWHLAWIDEGEWVKFTVHVNTAGIYYVSLKQATDGFPNLATITFNDDKPDSIKDLKRCFPLPKDCSETYHAWNVYTNVDSMTLDTGLFVMKYQFVKGGLNFDWVKFTLKSATAIKTRSNLQTTQSLNLATMITGSDLNVAYTLPLPGTARLSVVDCAGRATVPASIRNMNAGSHTQTIGLSGMGTGMYFVQVEHNGVREIKSFLITR